MKRILLLLIVLIIGMAAYGQDMSYFTQEYMRADSTFAERLAVLEVIRDMGTTGIGEFHHNALRFLLLRAPDIRTATERSNAEQSVVILAQGIGAEKVTAAAPDLWQAVEVFDVIGNSFDGNAMRASLIALGQVEGKQYIPQLVQRLSSFNTQSVRNPEQRRRVNMAVIGLVSALEALKDIRGYRPVFFASVGPYDADIRQLAFDALPNIVDDPADVIIEIIQEPSSDPQTKLNVWREMFRSKMPDSSKAKVAAAALETGWIYQTQNRNFQTNLRELRKGALDIIRLHGVANDSVYFDLERSYSRNFISNNPDFDEVRAAINALAAVKSEQAVNLLLKFIREINGRRRSGPWGNKERLSYELLINAIGTTGTQSMDVRLQLTTISRNTAYTAIEREMAANAMRALGF